MVEAEGLGLGARVDMEEGHLRSRENLKVSRIPRDHNGPALEDQASRSGLAASDCKGHIRARNQKNREFRGTRALRYPVDMWGIQLVWESSQVSVWVCGCCGQVWPGYNS